MSSDKLLEFNHNVKVKKVINQDYRQVNDMLKDFEGQLHGVLDKNRGKYMDKFTGEMKELHDNYRALEEKDLEL